MAPKEEVYPLRDLVKKVLDNQEKMIEQSHLTNIELVKQGAIIENLSADNKKNKEFIEAQKKINWTFSGVFAAVMAFIKLS